MIHNVTDGGEIGNDESECGSYNPSIIESIADPTGGNGDIEYLWLSSTEGCPTSLDQAIDGATESTYDPGPISQTTYYLRCSRRSGCSFYFGESNCIIKEVTGNITDGGEIGNDESRCGPYNPSIIESLEDPTGGSGDIEYLWLSSTEGCPTSLDQAIPGATESTYDPRAINQTTYYLRCSRRSGCSFYIGESNCVVKEVTGLCDNYCTYTIGFWGHHDEYVKHLFCGHPISFGMYDITDECADYILPGPPQHKQNDVHCGVSSDENTSMLRQAIALRLNLMAAGYISNTMDNTGDLNGLKLSDIEFCGNDGQYFEDYIAADPDITVFGLYLLAHEALNTATNDTDLTEAMSIINERFDECQENAPCSGGRSDLIGESDFGVVLSPNPVNDVVQLSVNSKKEGKGSINIYNLKGELVMVQNLDLLIGQNDTKLNVYHWNAGIYQATIFVDGQMIYKDRFIKIRD